MLDFIISRADVLKSALSWLLKVSSPSDIATICFHDGRMALLASPSDGGTIGLISFGNGKQMDNDSWFGNLSLQRLQEALNLSQNDEVHFYSISRSCIMKIESDITRSPVMIPVVDPPNPKLVHLESNRHQYPLKLAINAKVFLSIMRFFKDMDTDKVFFQIIDSQVTFFAGAEYEKIVLLREHEQVEYQFNGVVPEEGGVDYFGSFSLEILNHMDFRNESVWIYPPDGGLPAGLGCIVDAVCDTMLYSLKQPDPRIFRAKPGKSAVQVDRAAHLRTAVSLLPGQTATFKFLSNGVSIVGSSEDRSLTAMLELSNSDNFTCKLEEFFDINIDDLCRALEHGGDSDEVHISTHELCLIMRIRDPEGQDTWKRIESDSVNLLNAKFEPSINNYKVMACLRSRDFARVLRIGCGP